MTVLCLLIVFVSSLLVKAFGNTEISQFEKFMIRFKKSYSSKEEFQYRLQIFTKNMEQARLLQQAELGTAVYGVTKYSDLTDQEFGIQRNSKEYNVPPTPIEKTESTMQPECDWRKSGFVSEVKDQGLRCKSSWAFAAVSNIETLWGINGHSTNLSVQQLIDCNVCGDGCKRGYQWHAFRTVLFKNLATENDYQEYQGRKNKCDEAVMSVWWISGFEMLPRNENAMSIHLSYNGTLTVVINSTPLKLYKGGVIHQPDCSKRVGDHVALIVGYHKKKKTPYWILKNSWGKDWGENGYFRLYWGKNSCGVTSYPLSATLDRDVKAKCPM
uniref:Uncharacterized protein n=1 Tax=Leptobrachium leishanense TaxID=445787 RepID=A0A8C5PCN1_9ANUR